MATSTGLSLSRVPLLVFDRVDNVTIIEYGVIGLSVGVKTGTKTHKSDQDASAYAKLKIAEKVARGYEETETEVRSRLAEESGRFSITSSREKKGGISSKLDRAAEGIGKRSLSDLEEDK
ncbi:MAG: hypothetical protein P4M11_10635 [Candidatus Pacebacteria bacterium]|nr:hypothetical protein [Candidatus Paceibacterota bacterium]